MSLGAIVNDSLLQKYQSQNDQYRQELVSISEKLNKHTRLIDECLSVRSSVEELRAFHERQNQMNSRGEDLFFDLIEGKKSAVTTVAKLEKQMAELKKENESLRKDLTDALELIKELNKKFLYLPFDNQIRELAKGQTNHIAETRKEMQKIRDDLVVSPAQIISNNSDLLKKLEVAQLDGSNAMSKVSNFELQIRVLEKKIESLGIQLKKIELGQQLV